MQKEINRIRTRFVLVVMLIVTVVIACIFGSFVEITRRSFDRTETDFLSSIALDPRRFGAFGKDSETQLPYIVFQVLENEDEATPVAVYSSSRISDDFDFEATDNITEVIDLIHKSSAASGRIQKYKLRFLKVNVYDNLYNYAIINVANNESVMKDLRWRITGFCFMTIVVFTVIAAVLSKWMVRPVERAWEQQKQFVSDASHELKTPLTVITTNAELLQTEGLDETEKSKYTNNIVTVSHQMRGLVEDLLNLSRLDKLEKSSFTEVNLSDSYSNSLLQFEPVMFELGLNLVEDIEPGIIVKGSEQRLDQLLTILLDNAGKYSKPGDVNVSLKKTGKHALLTVSNPADPLTDEQLSNIFKRFYRVDESHNEKSSYGLGLPIAKSICESHGGKINAACRDGLIEFKATIPTA